MLVDAYFISECPVCTQGLLVLRTTSQAKRVICICDECESIWTQFQNLNSDSCLSEMLDSYGYSQALQDFVFFNNSHWTSEQEAQEARLLSRVKGTVKIPKETSYT